MGNKYLPRAASDLPISSRELDRRGQRPVNVVTITIGQTALPKYSEIFPLPPARLRLPVDRRLTTAQLIRPSESAMSKLLAQTPWNDHTATSAVSLRPRAPSSRASA